MAGGLYMKQDTLKQEPPAAGGRVPVAVSVTGLVRHFGEIEAVKGVTFDVGSGEIFAFLGPNGAGKSTTIKMLCTLLRPTAGHATVAGYDVTREPKSVRANIGLVFQDRTLDEQLTAEENLAFHGALYGIPQREIPERSARVFEMVGLPERRGDLVSTFSGGMAPSLEAAGFDLSVTSDGVLVRTADGESAVPLLIDRAGVPVRLVRVRRPTLDDVFLHYTGREMRSETEASSMMRQFIAARRR